MTTFKMRTAGLDKVCAYVAANHGLRCTYSLMQSLAARKRCSGGTLGSELTNRSLSIVQRALSLVRNVQNEVPAKTEIGEEYLQAQQT